MKFEQLPRENANTDVETQDSLSDLLRFWRRGVAKHKRMIILLTALVGAIEASSPFR